MPSGNAGLEVPVDTLNAWQDTVDLLAEIVGVPTGLIMRLSDPEIEVLVSSKGADNPYHPGDREHVWGSGLYCETVIKTQEKLHIPNALSDPKWSSNPDIKLNMIAYLGLPILLPDGSPFGTICLLDKKENHFSRTFEKLLVKFRNLVQSNLESIYFNHSLGEKNKKLTDYLWELQSLRGIVQICSSCKSLKGAEGDWHPVEHYFIRHPEAVFSHGICPTCMENLYPEMARGQEK
ncbi:MAG: GAF domain-containing protein [Candidatus Hydrogenedentales bacterium]